MKTPGARGVVGAMLGLSWCAGVAALPHTIVDPGLHRQWLVEQDRAHPERPARLVEVPWVSAPSSPGETPQDPGPRRPVAVRAGMQVTLSWRDGEAEIRLMGTALEAGRVGETVRVRAGLHGAVLRGVVRGPAVVELERGRF